MSLRTYSLIVHPAYVNYVNTGVENADLARVRVDDFGNGIRPTLESALDIAKFVGVSPDVILSILAAKGLHYREFVIKKRSGGIRTISAPRTFLKVIQWWILDTILSEIECVENVYGFVKGRGFIGNANLHVDRAYLLNVDIKDYFPSVTERMVFSAFRRLGYSQTAASGLANITTLNGSLPQGAPTSPAISNYVFHPIDIMIADMAERRGYQYSRYADDLTFSSETRIPASFVGEVESMLHAYGFVLNQRKTRFMGKNQAKEVTGLVVTPYCARLSRKFLNGTRGWFHKLAMQDAIDQKTRERVTGTLELLRSVGGTGTASVVQLGERALRKRNLAP